MTDRELRYISNCLDQLLELTGQLSRCEEDPDIDVAALTRTCRDLLSDLKAAMPEDWVGSTGRGENAEIKGERQRQVLYMLKELDVQTRHCVEVLRRGRDRAESELASLRNVQKAVRAYNRSR